MAAHDNDPFYLRYYTCTDVQKHLDRLLFSTGHSGKHGHEFLEFEYSHGRLRYANNSNYDQNATNNLIRREMWVGPLVVKELKRIVDSSEITTEDDTNWPKKNIVGKQELEIRIGNDHIAFETGKIGSLVEIQDSEDPEGLRVFYYLVQDLKCLIFSLVSLHFKSKPVSVFPCYDSKARECSRDEARCNSTLLSTKERQPNIQHEICIVNPSISPAYTMEISTFKTNRVREVMGYAALITSPPDLIQPNPLAYGYFTPPPPAGFPKTHLSHPTQLLDGFSNETINACLFDSVPKIIARLFNFPKSHGPADTDLPRAVLTLAINSIITQINPLFPLARQLFTNRFPFSDQTCTIIALPSETVQTILLERRIWSSSFITFEAFPFTITSFPTPILALSGFATEDPKTPLSLIQLVWNLPRNAKRIANAISLEGDAPGDERFFIKTLVASSKMEAFANVPQPGFNFVIHASPPYKEAAQWARLKLVLFSLDYDNHNRMGRIRPIHIPSCSLCYSASHPRSSCPFPKVPFWNGPK